MVWSNNRSEQFLGFAGVFSVAMWGGLLVALALDLLVSSCLAAGEDDPPLSGELKDLLGATRHGLKLGSALVVALVTYYIATVKH